MVSNIFSNLAFRPFMMAVDILYGSAGVSGETHKANGMVKKKLNIHELQSLQVEVRWLSV